MKRLSAMFVAGLLLALVVPGTAFATPPTGDLTTQAWRIQYANPATNYFWEIDKVKLDASGDLTFPVRQYVAPTTGSFATYFQNNYNTSLTTSTTLFVDATWTPGTYASRSGAGAFGRFWFQSDIGNWDSNSYWWYSGDSLDLNTVSAGTMTAALSDTAHWSNICGKLATDTAVYSGPDCVGGTYPAVSPADGVANAMANVKQLGISFGSTSRYASGIARMGADGEFSMSAFDVITTP
jgi:hypothetical protein